MEKERNGREREEKIGIRGKERGLTSKELVCGVPFQNPPQTEFNFSFVNLVVILIAQTLLLYRSNNILVINNKHRVIIFYFWM